MNEIKDLKAGAGREKEKDPSTAPLRGSAQDDRKERRCAQNDRGGQRGSAQNDRGKERSAQDDRRAAEGVGLCGAGKSPAAGTSSAPSGQLPSARGRLCGGDHKRGPWWELRQALQRDGVLQLYIYGDVEGDWYDWWTDREIESETSADYFREQLGRYPDVEEIEIYINSYGGEVFEGTAIYNQLKRHPAHKTVYIDGFACSIASVIAMAGDVVVMPQNALMMIHNMWMGAVGNAAQLRKAADDLDVINAAGRAAYLLKAGDKLEETRLVEMMDAETWLTADDCIALGLADRYADEEADLTGSGQILQRVNAGLEQQIERHKAIAARLREITGDAGNAGIDPSTPLRSAQDDKKGSGSAQDDKSGLRGSAQDDKGETAGGDPSVGSADSSLCEREPKKDEKPGLMSFLAGVEI